MRTRSNLTMQFPAMPFLTKPFLAIPISMALLLSGCDDPTSAGASSPRALLDKLVDGLETHDAEMVASCFDRSTDEGFLAAGIMHKAVVILKKTKEFEDAVRDRFGDAYVLEHVEMPGPALFLGRLRELIATQPLTVQGGTARLGTDTNAQALIYAPDSLKKKWFLTAPHPFAQDEEISKGVHRVLDAFGRHADEALALIRPAQNEADFRLKMATLAIRTKAESKIFLDFLWQRFSDLGIRRW